jgi:molybdopterin-guanine dinucleotide biosynthesis protein
MFRTIGEVAYRLFATWMNKTIELPDRHMSDLAQALDELHPCDVVLVEGRSRAAGLIKTITQTNWTHVALYAGRKYPRKINLTKKV